MPIYDSDRPNSPNDGSIYNPYFTDRPKTPPPKVDRQEIIRKIKSKETSPEMDNQEIGMEIQRPRSALHRGDFRQDVASSPPWHADLAAATFRNAWNERRRKRAFSNMYQPPTSPLVNQSRPDTPPLDIRRHTRIPTLRKESTYPYQAHQPRRSITSLSSPPRRQSHHNMVGSYEESILLGRMSTTPSKPLNFVAQIGVLGRACKPSLKCPPHLTIPFPAVFYSYGASGDQPSPYVGQVDLDSGRRSAPGDTQESRRSGSPGYRIPQQGQLQIIIKNPNKTAVKLFLVPYDLSDMKPGQKTFIRQRSYSAGPIIDMPLSTQRDIINPEASLNSDPTERPVLRYLIHLHICCTGRGRFYLYKGIRVVFANRVPDGKEKLRNEIQLPEPRYSIYKAQSPPASPQGFRRQSDQTHTAFYFPDIQDSRPIFPFPSILARPSSRSTDIDSDCTRSEDPVSPTSPTSPLFARSLGEPFQFERNTSPVASGESLLSRRLRGLGM